MQKIRQSTFTIIGLAASLWIVAPNGSLHAAPPGECKHRQSNKDAWTTAVFKFDDCKKLNAEYDKDNLFASTGTIWWDKSAATPVKPANKPPPKKEKPPAEAEGAKQPAKGYGQP